MNIDGVGMEQERESEKTQASESGFLKAWELEAWMKAKESEMCGCYL